MRYIKLDNEKKIDDSDTFYATQKTLHKTTTKNIFKNNSKTNEMLQ